MISKAFDWSVGYTKAPGCDPQEWYPATVPGAVQLDYAKAKQWHPYEYGVNFQDYAWMEDVFWCYRTQLDFSLDANQTACVRFGGIDYRYQIRMDGAVIADGEGMFTPVTCEVSRYADQPHILEVLIYPAPKADDSNTRDQARKSCKPAACYGWDWHPRLISAGLFDKVELLIQDARHIKRMDVSYQLSDSLARCDVDATLELPCDAQVLLQLLDGDTVVAEEKRSCTVGQAEFSFTVDSPKLWYPVGYGEHPVYTLRGATLDEQGNTVKETVRRIGFRRSRMVMNEGSWKEPGQFPKSRSDAPATLEINGRRIFAKGSNWVNADIFPGAVTDADYDRLVTLAQQANMNILRIWGGGFVNHEAFFDLCDEKGIMVWQEFPLACNEYPDEDGYLSVLEQEATSIVRRLRSHPCVVLWCGGNELFNSWSKMTEQHHALRLLDKVCYTEDRFTPFIMTSPLNGMAHGHYFNYDESKHEEFISLIVRSNNTAYTEFGGPGAAATDYIKQYLSAADYADCDKDNEAWCAHHAFGAWQKESWLRKPEVDHYFGGYDDVDDLCEKTRFIQSMCYRSYFEEMRKQWPHCSMALNWCFNEPWPSFANNSLLSWPDIPKPGYYAVQAALRPQLASLRIDRHLWWAGETFRAEVWLLNDGLEELSGLDVEVSYSVDGGEPVRWGTLHAAKVEAQRNLLCGGVRFAVPVSGYGKIRIWLKVPGRPEMDSEYTYLFREKKIVSTKGMLNM